MKMRILTIVILISQIYNSSAQIDTIAGTKGIAQIKRNFCWAACTQMVMKKHQEVVPHQCALGLKYYNSIRPTREHLSKCDSCNSCFPKIGVINPRLGTFFSDKCDVTISDTSFVRIFKENNYKSQQTTTFPINFTFPWDTITKQIRNKTPFIMTIQFEASTNVCLSNHAVVGYGIDSNQIIYLNPKNPSLNCSSRVEKIPYKNVSTNSLPKPCRFIYNISPNTPVSTTISSRSVSGSGGQSLAVNYSEPIKSIEDISLFKGEIRQKISKKQLEEYKNSKDYLVVPVKFVSHLKMIKDGNRILNLDEAIIKKQFVDVINLNAPYTVTTLQKKCSKWHPIHTTHFEEDLNYSTSIDSQKIVLKQKRINLNNTKPIDFIVKYPELGLDFYEFKNQSQSYLIPFADYPYILNKDKAEESLKVLVEGKPYNQEIVVRGLQFETKLQQQSIQNPQNPASEPKDNIDKKSKY
jgi:hypothetical protein